MSTFPVSVLLQQEKELLYRVQLKIQFNDKIYSGIPKKGSVLDWFMSNKQMSDAEKASFQARVKEGALTDEEKTELKETGWCVFERDLDGDLCLWHGNIKAMLREIFTTLGYTQREWIKRSAKDGIEGSSGGRQMLQHGVHVAPIRPKLMKDGKPLKEAEGHDDKVKIINDMSGRRTALGRHDWVFQPEMTFELVWPHVGIFCEEDMKKSLALCQYDGLGACRSQGIGTFTVIEWTTLNVPAIKHKPKPSAIPDAAKAAKKGDVDNATVKVAVPDDDTKK